MEIKRDQKKRLKTNIKANKIKSNKIYDMTNTKWNIEQQHYYDNGSNSEIASKRGTNNCEACVWKSRSSLDFGAQIQILVAYAVRRDLLAKSSDMGQSQNNVTDWCPKGYHD